MSDSDFDSQSGSFDDDEGPACVIFTLNDVQEMFNSLSETDDINAPLDNGETLLVTVVSMAGEDGALSLLRELLDAGADCSDGVALCVAVECCFEDTVQLLLERGAPVDGCRGSVDTPLVQAVTNGSLAIVRCLLDKGASAMDRSSNAASLLELAPTWPIAELLLSRAPDLLLAGDPAVVAAKLALFNAAPSTALLESLVSQRPHADLVDALDSACEVGNIAAARLLLQSQNAPTVSTAAFGSACCRSVELVDLLLEHGAREFLDDSADLLTDAMQCERADVVRRLLALGVDPLKETPEGSTSLHWSAMCDSVEILLTLLPHCKAAINKADGDGRTPLLFLLGRGEYSANTVEMARILLDAGADVRVRDANSTTTLMLAAQSDTSGELTRLLLEHDPSLLNVTDDNGDTALSAAACVGDKTAIGAIKVLLDAGATVGVSDAHQLVLHGNLDALQLLVDHGFDVKAREADDGPTLLAQVPHIDNGVPTSQVDVATWLIDRGVPVNATWRREGEDQGETALLVACECAATDLVRFLLDAGADIEASTETGTTPLIAAVWSGCGETVRLLMERGAKPVGRPGKAIGAESMESGGHEALIALAAVGVDVQNWTATTAALQECSSEFMCTLLLLDVLQSWDGDDPEFAGIASMWGLPLKGRAARAASRKDFAVHRRNGVRAFNRFCTELIATEKLRLINPRAATICFALQSAALPALLTLAIIDEACPLAPLLPMHLKWDMITKIKHHRQQK